MSGHYVKLVNEQQIGRVADGFYRAIALSFGAGDWKRATRSEVKRRFDICDRIFSQLRGDLGWGIERILDNLPEYLRCELDGISWTPDRRTVWLPSDG